MKQPLIYAFFLLSYCSLPMYPAANINPETQQLLAKLETQYPALNAQIAALSRENPAALDFNHSLATLFAWLSGTSPQVKAAMELILQAQYYRDEQASSAGNMLIDGNGNDWQQISHKVNDAEGDSFQKRADMDITAAKAFLDADFNLNVLIQFKKQPVLKERIDVLINFYGNQDYDYQFLIYGAEDGKVYNGFYDLSTNKSIDKPVEYKVQKMVEAKIPLKNLALPNARINILPRCFDAKATVIDSTVPITLHTGLINYPLLLLLTLLEKDCFISEDPVGAAIALVNSYLYELADNETKQRIIEDCRAQFHFYEATINWQAAQGIKYGLKQTGVLPKICWADRSSYYLADINDAMSRFNTQGKLTLSIYNEFVDKIERLRELQQIIIDEQLLSHSLPDTAQLLEDFVHVKRIYRSSIENLVDFNKRKIFSDEDLRLAREEIKLGEYETDYFGKKRRWDEYRWLNYQCRLFAATGNFKGDCGDTTVVQMGFYRAAGIAPLSFQWVHKEGLAAFTHNFPGYYDPLRTRWYSIQKPTFYLPGGKTTENVEIFFYFTKPAWHPWFYTQDMVVKSSGKTTTIYSAYYQGELTDSNRLFNFLTLGMSKQQFQEIFFSAVTMQPGLFFSSATAPLEIQDTDFDGIADSIEKEMRLNPGKADSDQDGFSDNWEVNNGSDPLNAGVPADQAFVAIDGIQRADFETVSSAVYDPGGDSRAVEGIYDIKSLGARVDGDNLYLAVNFHNQIQANTGTKCHSFLVSAGKREAESYWIQWYNTYLQVFDARELDATRWIKLPVRGGYAAAALFAAEFRIPLALFKNRQELFIQYFAGGYTDKKQSFDTACDYTDPLRISSGADALSSLVTEAVNRGTRYEDAAGDYKQVRYIKDIKALTAAVAGNRLVCYVEFFRVKDVQYGIHSFLIKSKNTGLNYWVQWIYINYVRVWSWKDDEASGELAIDSSLFPSLGWQDGYAFILPGDFFKADDVLYIQYQEGSYDAQNAFLSDADKIDKIRVSMGADTLSYLQAQQPESTATVKDAGLDYKGDKAYQDIKDFTVAVYQDYLLCTAAFHNRLDGTAVGIQTIYIRNPETGMNWWVQWWDLGHFKYYSWKDGEKMQVQEDWMEFFDIRCNNNGYAFLIPLHIIRPSVIREQDLKKQETRLEIKYYAGAEDKDGNNIYDADFTEPLNCKIGNKR